MRNGLYDDMLHLPHHRSSRHPHMTMENRAAQFSPFAALTGYEDAVEEAKRLTDKKVELDENEKEILDRRLRYIRTQKDQDITVTWFVPDDRKEGGSYKTATGTVKKMDSRRILMKNGEDILIENIVGIDIDNYKR